MVGLFCIGGRRRSDERCLRAGLSLIELLIVMAVIALISGLAIPLMFRMGLFAGNRVELATREIYSALRAAKIYAATHNVEAGLAYVGRLDDPNGPTPLTVDSYTGQNNPVVDSYVTVRRLKREELRAVNLPEDIEVYVPAGADEAEFKYLPRQTCLLPDIFQVATLNNSQVSYTGLRKIAVVQSTDYTACLTPRSEYVVSPTTIPGPCDSLTPAYFPAHIFKPSGELRVANEGLPQRLTFRVGLLPNEDPNDRYTVDPGTVPDVPGFNQNQFKIPIDVVFDGQYQYTLYRHPDPSLSETEYADNDRSITLYRSQGRIKIEP